MKRRTFIAGLGATAAWPFAACAQQPGVPLIGYLGVGAPTASNVAGLRKGLSEQGYVEGRNVKYYHTFVDEKYERFPANAQQLVEQKVDVIMASVANAAAAAAKLTNTIPIVFAASGEPVRAGLVESVDHPGGQCYGLLAVLSGTRNQAP